MATATAAALAAIAHPAQPPMPSPQRALNRKLGETFGASERQPATARWDEF